LSGVFSRGAIAPELWRRASGLEALSLSHRHPGEGRDPGPQLWKAARCCLLWAWQPGSRPSPGGRF